VAYVDALRSRVRFLEKLFLQLKTGKEEETGAFLKKLRSAGDSNMVLGQSIEPLDRSYSDDLQKDSPYGIISSDGCTMPNASSLLEAEYGTEQSEKDDQDGLPATLLDGLSQVMSQLDVDEGGEVHYFGPSSNLNLVSDIPRVPPPPRTRGRSESVTSSMGMSADFSDVDQDFAVGSVDPLTAGDDFGSGSYYGFGAPPSIYTSAAALGFRQDYSAAQALEDHLLTLYWTWQHPFFLLFSKRLFLRDMEAARTMKVAVGVRMKHYSPLLHYAILAHAAHLSPRPEVRSDPNVPATAGNRYFAKARKLLEAECESPSMTTIQALALMGSREAGCGRDTGLGWLYSGVLRRTF